MSSPSRRQNRGLDSTGDSSFNSDFSQGLSSNNNNNNAIPQTPTQNRLRSQQNPAGTPQRSYGRSDLGVLVPDFNDILRQHELSSTTGTQSSSQLHNHSSSDPQSTGNSDSGLSSSGSGYSSNHGGLLSSLSDSETSTLDFEIREGTVIKPVEAMQLFHHFFRTFKLHDDDEPYYLRELDSVLKSSNAFLNLDLNHVSLFAKGGDQLFEAIVYFPTATIPIIDFILNELARDIRTRFLNETRSVISQGGINRNNADLLGNSEGDNRSDSQGFGLLSGDNLDSAQHQHLLEVYHPHTIKVRPFNMTLINSRQLQPHDIDGLVSIRGIILRVSNLKPELKYAVFPCNTQGCGNVITFDVYDGRLKQPTLCNTCNKRDTFYLAHNMSRYASKQVVRIQEVPEDITDGETPHTMSLCVYDELVDTVKPGDRIVVTGIFRGQNVRLNPNKRAVKSNLFTYVDAFHFQMVSSATKSKQPGDPNQDHEINHDMGIGLDPVANKTDTSGKNAQINPHRPTLPEQDEQILLSLGQRPDIYDLLARSIAPSVWGMDDVKKGLLTMLIGGNNLEGDAIEGDSGAGSDDSQIHKKRGKRGVVHVLLVGDPGTAKSQLLQYIHKLSTRGVYTSGTASSAAGLTAAVIHDPIQNESVLEPGALVLSDCDICCIDEFDKMSASAQSILHEAMEQQTVSIAKAGVICSLSARTTILASANPRDSRYNPSLSIVQNIDLSPTLLSRFDLIYIVLDTPNPQSDERLSEHLLSLFMSDDDRTNFRETNTAKLRSRIGAPIKYPNTFGLDLTLPLNDSGEEFLPTPNLLQYINFARTLIPMFDVPACEELENCYLTLRGSVNDLGNGDNINDSILSSAISGGNGNVETTISATPRQLQSLIRISESIAKLHLRDVITAADVREAARLIRTATLSAAIDPTTGKIDMSALNTGISFSDRKLIETCAFHVRSYLVQNMTRLTHNLSEIFDAVHPMNREFTLDIVIDAVKLLQQEDAVDYNHNNQVVRIKSL